MISQTLPSPDPLLMCCCCGEGCGGNPEWHDRKKARGIGAFIRRIQCGVGGHPNVRYGYEPFAIPDWRRYVRVIQSCTYCGDELDRRVMGAL